MLDQEDSGKILRERAERLCLTLRENKKKKKHYDGESPGPFAGLHGQRVGLPHNLNTHNNRDTEKQWMSIQVLNRTGTHKSIVRAVKGSKGLRPHSHSIR